MSETQPSPKPKLRRFQYRLWHLFVLTGVMAIVCAGVASFWTWYLRAGVEYSRAPAPIEELGGYVAGDSGLAAEGVPVVHLSRVRPWSDAYLKAFIEYLETPPNLKEVLIFDSQVSDTELEYLKALVKLEKLGIVGSPVTDAGVTLAAIGCRWFACKMVEANKQREPVKAIQEFGGYVRYDYDYQVDAHGVVRKSSTVPLGLAWFRNFVGVDFLADVVKVNLRHTRITDAGLEHLKELTKLEWLGLCATQVTDAGLEHLQGLTNLTNLQLVRTQITDAGLEHLAGLTNLRTLYLDATQVTDAGLEHLQGLAKLESLYLGDTQITDAGLEHLKGMTKLGRLRLSDTQVTDAGLKHLREMTKLKSLYLGRTQVTDAGVEHLQGMPQLEQLWLYGTQVTDDGLEHLKGLTNLRLLSLGDTQVTDDGIRKLRKALPKCRIHR